jgi:TetR/AcrR family fatty acid metabolism transcriptional regulator
MNIHSVATRDKRIRILEAAKAAFARQGYFGTTVGDVARRARVADGTIYLHFKDKEDLLVQLFESAAAEFIAGARALVAEPGAPLKRLERLLLLHLQLLGRDRDLAIVFQVELRHSLKYLRRFSRTRLRDYTDLIRALLAEGQAEGSVRADVHLPTATRVIFGALDETVTAWVVSQRPRPLASESERVMTILLEGLKA